MTVATRTLVALLLAALAAFALGACKKAPESAGGGEVKPVARSTTGAVIADKEALGFNVRIGEAFNTERLCEKLAKSSVKVDVAAQDATDLMVPGTVGDGTIYFWVLPDPRNPKVVGGLTIGVDINTALQIGKIDRAEFERIIKNRALKAKSGVGMRRSWRNIPLPKRRWRRSETKAWSRMREWASAQRNSRCLTHTASRRTRCSSRATPSASTAGRRWR